MSLSSGSRNNNNKDNNRYVRPVLAYLVKDIILMSRNSFHQGEGSELFFYQKRAADSENCYEITGSK